MVYMFADLQLLCKWCPCVQQKNLDVDLFNLLACVTCVYMFVGHLDSSCFLLRIIQYQLIEITELADWLHCIG